MIANCYHTINNFYQDHKDTRKDPHSNLHLFEEHSVRPDVLLVGSDEVLSLDFTMSHSDHIGVLHVDSVLEQHLVLLAIELKCGGVVLSDIRVRGAVDALNLKSFTYMQLSVVYLIFTSSKLKSFPLSEIIATGCNILGKGILGAVVGHRPLIHDTISPDGTLDAPNPLGVIILVFNVEGNPVPTIGPPVSPSSAEESLTLSLWLLKS